VGTGSEKHHGAVVLVLTILASTLLVGGRGAALTGGDTVVSERVVEVPAASGGVPGYFSVALQCGGRAIGGGAIPEQSFAASVQVQNSGPVDDSFNVGNTQSGDIPRAWLSAVRNSSTSAVSVKFFALCSLRSDALVEAVDFDVAAGAEGNQVAFCPGTTRVVSGGVGYVGAPRDDDSRLQHSFPVDETGQLGTTIDGDVARRWFGGVVNRSPVSSHYKVIALCSQDSDAEVAAATVQIPGGEFRVIGANCPGGRRVVGGGIATEGTSTGMRILGLGPLEADRAISSTTDGDTARSFFVSSQNLNATPRTSRAFALCASDDPTPDDGVLPPGGTPVPETIITSLPFEKTRDRTPTFMFASGTPAATFECSCGWARWDDTRRM
jgi:hypothetical protein